MKVVKLSSILAVTAVVGCQNDVTAPVSRSLNSTPNAAITFDPATGIGFVGKGDVQLFFGWNNQMLQLNAANIDFRYSSGSTTTWTCTRTWVTGPAHNQVQHEVVQERQNSVSTSGLITTQGRNNSQGLNGPNTGFVLSPEGGAVTTTASGPAIGSCPASPSGFVYDNNAQTESNGGGLQIINNGGPGPWLSATGKSVNTWYNFP
jgi:hypothetical protein